MAYIPPLNGGRINATIAGNTAGVGSLVSTGTLVLSGGNNITLSQTSNSIHFSAPAISSVSATGILSLSSSGSTVSIGAPAFSAGILSGTGNTIGTPGFATNQLVLAGGNNITLSQATGVGGNTLTISGASQSVQTQNNIQGIIASGSTNTTGNISFANSNGVTFGLSNNTVTASVATAGNGGVALSANLLISSGTASLAAGGALTISGSNQTLSLSVPNTSILSGINGIVIATTSDTVYVSGPGTSSYVGLNGVTVSTNGSTISISGPGNIGNTIDFYQNMDRGNSAALAVPYTAGSATLMLQRLNQENDEFAANITANTVLLNMSGSGSSNSSSAHTVTAYVGIYSDRSTAISLLNSASTSWALAANASNSLSYMGARWVSLVSSQWSSAPVFNQGAEYVFGVFFRASNMAPPLSYIGQSYMYSGARSGTLGAASNNNATLAQGNYWNATYSTTVTAFPSVISSNQVTRSGASAVFMPHIILNNRYSGTF